jgi:hypothetical protein
MAQWRAETCCWEICLKIHFNNYIIKVVLDYISYLKLYCLYTDLRCLKLVSPKEICGPKHVYDNVNKGGHKITLVYFDFW